MSYIQRTRREMLIDRAESQLISVHSLTKGKIKLYLDRLKSEVIRGSEQKTPVTEFPEIESSLEAVWKINNGKAEQLLGLRAQVMPNAESAPLFIFKNFGENKFFIKVKHNDIYYLWLFNFNGLNSILLQRDGLGETGEVYLVGPNKNIVSNSRFIEDWSTIKVHNTSVTNALAGRSGVHQVMDYRNQEVISAYGGIDYDELSFALLAEIDVEEVARALSIVFISLGIFAVVMIVVNLGLAIYLTRVFRNKFATLSEEVETLNREKERQANESAIQVIRIQEDEREKISFTLHDSVGQYLTVLKWGLSELKLKAADSEMESLDNLLNTCDDIIHEIRGISHDLMPALIRDFGGCLAIKDYFEKQKQIVPLTMNFTYAPELETFKFRKEFDINLYRMVQEFYQNTLKHSEAKAIDLEFLIIDNKFIMIYHDDGKGMPWNARLPLSLSYRAKLFGGEMVRLKFETGLGFKVSFNFKDISA